MPRAPILGMEGKTFGRWTVIARDERPSPKMDVRWFVRCQCGTEASRPGHTLRGGHSLSCGCSKRGEQPFDFAAYQRKWRAANPEKTRRNEKKHRDSKKGRAYRAAWIASGKQRKSQRKYRLSYRGMLRSALHRVEIRHRKVWPNEPFTITHTQIIDLWRSQSGLCALSGVEMTWGKGEQKPTSLSIDRIDCKRGYHLDNIRLICHAINCFRGAGTDAEMLKLARALVAWVDDDFPEFSPLRTAVTAADVAQPVGELQ